MMMAQRTLGSAVAAVLCCCSTSQAQSWIEFSEQTASRLVADPLLGAGDLEEKDYAWGDVDQDGDLDLVCVRKQPFDSSGRRPNVLFINEGVAEGHDFNGVLVDRTNLYATASNVPGDQGFLTPTNDRDVRLVDLTGDGWLDIVTAVTFSNGQPKHVSHPRVYVNLGKDKNQWLGFRHEDARIPQLAGIDPNNGMPYAPQFNAVAAGDVNGDGAADLYFVDGDFGSQPFDFGNRLLINDGKGFFTDQSQTLPAQAGNSGTCTACAIADLNGDGANDLLRLNVAGTSPVGLGVVYNDPTRPGVWGDFFTIYGGGSATEFSISDFNNDNRLDVFLTDDSIDRYLLNLGNQPSGAATFQQKSVSFQGENDQGFGGESTVADLDNDGFNDLVLTDVQFDIPGCSRNARLFRNQADVPSVTLLEHSPVVIPTLPSKGTHDAAVFDINGDGWKDIVLGRCSGTNVWINQPCAGDVIFDGEVDIDDVFAVIAAWGPCGTCPPSCEGDLNTDCDVDIDDLFTVIGAWGPCG